MTKLHLSAGAKVVQIHPGKPDVSIAKAATNKDKPALPYEIRDDRVPGLLLRVQPTGLRVFYVQIARGQRRKIGPAGIFTLELARESAKKVLRDPGAAAKTARAGATLSEYIDGEYNEFAQARLKNGAVSVSRVKAVWKSLLNKRMTDISRTEVDKLRSKRLNAGTAPATVNRDVAALSGVFAHWTENTPGAVHPLVGMEALDVADDETVRYLVPEESVRLRKALAARDVRNATGRANANKWRCERDYELLPDIVGYSDHLTPMVLLSLNSGLRQGELFALAWNHVDFKHKTLSVLASHSKGNKTRTVPLNAEALAVLTAIRPKPLGAGLVFKSPKTGEQFDNVRSAWAELTAKAEVPDLRWHDMRHDFASQLVMKGVPLFTVQKLLGHSSSKMTQRYARLASGNLADAVNLLGT